jgi:hypothetical protein
MSEQFESGINNLCVARIDPGHFESDAP